jgi:hypothetical protein
MTLLNRLGYTLYRTMLDFSGEFLNLALAPLGARLSLSIPTGTARLASFRALSRTTLDGAVLKGALPQAGAKFTLMRGLPSEEDGGRMAIENEPHVLNGFNGTIQEGYGKGTKTLLYRGPAIVKVGGGKKHTELVEYHQHDADRAGLHYDLAIAGVKSQTSSLRPKPIEIHFSGGPYGGRRFAIVNTLFAEGKGGRMIVPMRDQGVRLPKPEYRLKDLAWLAEEVDANPGKYIVETKCDGSLAHMHTQGAKAMFRSHREGGETYYDRLPALEDLSNRSSLWICRKLFPGPKLTGTVLKGELVHASGAAKVSGVLNSNPDKALEWQRNNGDIRFLAWDMAKYRGRDVSGRPYVERRALLDKVVAQIRMFNRSYETVDVKPDCVSAVEYFRSVVSGKGPLSEGVVVKEANASDPRWFKVKRFDAYDLEITEFVEGSGKYAGTLGALRVRSPQTGEIGEIGSFAIPDAERGWLWQNRSQLTGGFAQVQAMELSEARGVPRAGVFLAMHPSKGSESSVRLLATREVAQ